MAKKIINPSHFWLIVYQLTVADYLNYLNPTMQLCSHSLTERETAGVWPVEMFWGAKKRWLNHIQIKRTAFTLGLLWRSQLLKSSHLGVEHRPWKAHYPGHGRKSCSASLWQPFQWFPRSCWQTTTQLVSRKRRLDKVGSCLSPF